jgi:hypothetical protein
MTQNYMNNLALNFHKRIFTIKYFNNKIIKTKDKIMKNKHKINLLI